jgi:hypothetical protein
MPLEIAEYSVNMQTGVEQHTLLREIPAGNTEAVFNIGEVTGIYEELVLWMDERDSWFFRGGGGTVHLSDPKEVQFLVDYPARNIMQVRGEVFFYGNSERVVSIRRIPERAHGDEEGQGTTAVNGLEDQTYLHSLEQLTAPTSVDEYGFDSVKMRRLIDEGLGMGDQFL